MSVKLLVGVALFLIGLIAAGIGIVGVGSAETATAVIVEENTSTNLQNLPRYAIPVMAGLCLAAGAC